MSAGFGLNDFGHRGARAERPATQDGVSVSNVRSNACKSGDNCGVFMTIANFGRYPDTLLAAKTGVAMSAGLHTVVKG